MAKPVILRFLADTKQLDAAWRKIQADAAKTESVLHGMSVAGKGMVVVGRTMSRWVTLPLAVASGAAVKLAYDFDASMNKIDQLVGASKAQLAEYRREVLRLAPAVGKTPRELADALYFITSSGFEGATALRVLTASAKASAAGLGETMTVADAVTSAVSAYGPAVLSAARATDIMVATVREGKAEPESLAKELGKVISPAAQLGVTFDEVGAAIASMTRVGLDAPMATTALRQVFVSLIKPAKQSEDMFRKIGLSSAGLRREIQEKGLLSALRTITEHAKGQSDVLGRLFPNVRALTGFLGMMGPQGKETAALFRELAKTTGDTDAAFQKYSNTAQGKFHKAVATLHSLGIKLGSVLLPYVIDAVSWLARMAQKFDALDPSTKRLIGTIAAVAAATGPLIYLIGKLTLAFVAFGKHPIIGTLLLLAQAFIVAYANSEKFRGVVHRVVGAVASAVQWIKEHKSVLLSVAAAAGTFSAVLLVQRGLIAGVGLATRAWAAGLALARGAIVTTRVAMWLLNAAIAANPIGFVVALIAGLVAAFITAYKTSETFRNVVHDVWSAVKRGTGEAVGFLIDLFRVMLNNQLAIFDAMVSGAAKALGWIPGLGPKLKRANAAFDKWRVDLNATLEELANDARGWGNDVATGFAKGISAASYKAVDAAGDMANKVKAQAPQLLDMHSPSRVMEKQGRDVSGGFERGIRKGIPKAVKAASDAAKALAKTYRRESKQADEAQRRYRESIERARANGEVSKSEKITIRRARREARQQRREARRALEELQKQLKYEADLRARRVRGKPMVDLAASMVAGLDDLGRNLRSPIATAAEQLAEQIRTQFADKDGEVPDAIQSSIDRLKDYAGEVASFRESFVSALTGSADIFSAYRADEQAQDALTAALEKQAKAQQRLNDLQATAGTKARTLALAQLQLQHASDAVAVAQQQVTDATGVGGIKAWLRQQVNNITAFGTALRTLVARGLPPSIVRQLAAAGLEALPTAEALANSEDADFAEILSLQQQVDSLSGSLSSFTEGAIFGGGVGGQTAAAGTSTQSRTLTINVSAQTNADPTAIAQEIAWQLKTLGY